MSLTEAQRDALTEVVNIGAGKAGQRLAILLDDRIEMVVPHVDLVDYEELPKLLGIAEEEAVVCIQQDVSGSIAGEMLLMFHLAESRQLLQMLIAPIQPFSVGSESDIQRFEHEAMTEVGNIVISASASAMSGFLAGAVKLKVPRYNEGPLNSVLPQLMRSQGKTQALVMRTILRALRQEVSGTLIITIAVDDFNALLGRMDEIIAGISPQSGTA
jgi:chemotaxis protein CheC